MTDRPIPPDSDGRDIAFADAQRTNAEGTALATAVGLTAKPLCIAVTGTHGTTGLRSFMQSSVADHVLRHGRRPVLIVPPGA